MTDTTQPTGSPQDSRPTVPATADGAGRLSDEWIGRHPKMFTAPNGREYECSDACLCCDQAWSWSGLNEQRICINCWEHTATLRADVARLAVLETSAGRRCAEAEAALAASESRARGLREAADDMTARFEYAATAIEKRCLIEHRGCYTEQKMVDAMRESIARYRALAAANAAGPATQPAAPTCKWCWTAVPSWGDVCASCEANMLAAHSDLAASDGPGAAPSGEA